MEIDLACFACAATASLFRQAGQLHAFDPSSDSAS